MRLIQGLAAVVLMASAAVAQAQVTATVTAASDYNFRGQSLSAKDPVLQGSIDYAHDIGAYFGIWGSNIDYGDDFDGNIEIDVYAGFAGGFAEDFGYDVGLVVYTYPTSSGTSTKSEIRDYPEIYGGLTWKWFEVKQWYTNDYGGSDEDAFYTEGNASFELPANFSVNLHAGYNYGDAYDDPDTGESSDWVDYSVGLGYTVGNVDLSVAWVDTSLSDGDYIFSDADVFNTEGRVVFSVSTTFPWGKE